MRHGEVALNPEQRGMAQQYPRKIVVIIREA